MGKQLSINIYQGQRGGRRPGSGRKRIHSKGVSHQTREKVTQKTPLHINFKYKAFIRNKHGLKLLKKAVLNARAQGLRILHYSLQSNHVHIVVEATNNAILTRGMRSLTVTFAKGLNKGKVQIQRYHLHVLKTLKETKNAIFYVLFNKQKHLGLKTAILNSYSSLGRIPNLKELAKEAKMTIVRTKAASLIQLDLAHSWYSRRAMNQLGC